MDREQRVSLQKDEMTDMSGDGDVAWQQQQKKVIHLHQRHKEK